MSIGTTTTTTSDAHTHHHHKNKKRRKDRLDRNSHIAIIGSGLGGLGAAISLELAGFTNIVLYERDVSVDSRREGYGLTLSYNPQGPLAYMGFWKKWHKKIVPVGVITRSGVMEGY
ncbi:FAD-binding domain-containing protein [Fragilaria crotonensis]|nr:FAD-binding domain-containing protein [Fragilaria crotonensis]